MKTDRMVTLILGLVVSLTVQSARAAGSMAKFGMKWNALIGEWKGESASGGGGSCGFHPDLSDQIIVRTNHAALQTAGDKPASSHDDLMVICPGA